MGLHFLLPAQIFGLKYGINASGTAHSSVLVVYYHFSLADNIIKGPLSLSGHAVTVFTYLAENKNTKCETTVFLALPVIFLRHAGGTCSGG